MELGLIIVVIIVVAAIAVAAGALDGPRRTRRRVVTREPDVIVREPDVVVEPPTRTVVTERTVTTDRDPLT